MHQLILLYSLTSLGEPPLFWMVRSIFKHMLIEKWTRLLLLRNGWFFPFLFIELRRSCTQFGGHWIFIHKRLTVYFYHTFSSFAIDFFSLSRSNIHLPGRYVSLGLFPRLMSLFLSIVWYKFFPQLYHVKWRKLMTWMLNIVKRRWGGEWI